MDILFGIAVILVVVVLVLFVYSVFQDMFEIFVSPIINNRLDKRINVLYQMGLYESASIVRLQFRYSWWDLIR